MTAGTLDRSDNQYLSPVERLIIHERFNRSDPIGQFFDIALLILNDSGLKAKHINENETDSYLINQVCLPEHNVTNSDGQTAWFSGFGVDDPNNTFTGELNKNLKKAEYKLSAPSKCDLRQVCVYEEEHPSCWVCLTN